MISFNDTEIAFANKTNEELKKAFVLFKIVANPTIVKIGKFFTNLAIKIRLPIEGIVKKTVFHQFCGGESVNDCIPTINKLADSDIGAILDYSVEGKKNIEGLDEAKDRIIRTIHQAKKFESIPFAVFKLTGVCTFDFLINYANNTLTEADEPRKKRALGRIGEICEEAARHEIPIFIDAEESWIQDAIDDIALNMMRKYNKEKALIYNTIQFYRKDRLAYLEELHQTCLKEGLHLGVKLVRGAYIEKERKRAKEKNYPDPIHDTKADTDRDFNTALEYCAAHVDSISFCAGTHNEQSTMKLIHLMELHEIAKQDKRVYFAQLFGMSDHISYNLAHEGYLTAKYLPFGPVKDVLPYIMRRAEENSSIKGQTGRELLLITTELNRRKLQE